jgi:hypothetical protein
MSHPQDYNARRIVLRRTGEEGYIPPVNIPSGVNDEAPYKNELVINSYSPKGGIESSAGIYLRVGEQEKENIEDQIIRIGKVIVTNDSVTSISPSVAYKQSSTGGRLLETGELWLRTSDHSLFVHDGSRYVRVSSIDATEETKGVLKICTDAEAIEGTTNSGAVTPKTLTTWRNELQLLTRQTSGKVIYVDQTIGDDNIENDGFDSRHPFLTIERAFLQASLLSYVPGTDNDLFQVFTIVVGNGDYTIDNRPGLSDKSGLLTQAPGSVGPINPIKSQAILQTIDIEFSRFVIAGDLSNEVYENNQIYNSRGASAVIVRYTEEGVVVRNIRGQWSPGDDIFYSDYSAFNPPSGGVVLPRGCSLIGEDLRKCIIRPRYLGDPKKWLEKAGPCTCAQDGLSARLKITGGSYIANITFRDSLRELSTHHLLVAIISASNSELSDFNYGYYPKVAKGLGQTVLPPIELESYQTNPLETSIVTTAETAQEVDDNGFNAVNTVEGSSAYISNCSLLSRFGARGLVVDGSLMNGFKSIIVERFTNISLQEDPRAFSALSTAPDGKVYKDIWRHASFEAQNGGYAQLVSCFTIAAADHFRALSGGELSLANCFTNFGDTAFIAKGYLNEAFPQNKGIRLEGIIPPTPIEQNTREIYLGNVSPSTTSSQIYTFSPLDLSILNPFELTTDDYIYVKDNATNSIEYKAKVLSLELSEDSNGTYISVDPSDNTIFPNITSTQFSKLYIKRIPDIRQADETIYWLHVSLPAVEGFKPPQLHHVIEFNESIAQKKISKTLFIAAVRRTTFDDTPLPRNEYYVALLTSDPVNESLKNIYPTRNVNKPEENPLDSLTYKSTTTLLKSLGASDATIKEHLQASEEEIPIIDELGPTSLVSVDFKRPSTIRSFGTGLEWVGYGNYSSALPKYQTNSLTQQESLAKIKQEMQGGRVYNVGMTQDGEYVLGDKVLDLKTGNELNLELGSQEDQQSIATLITTNKLQVVSNATLDVSSAGLVFDNQTRFLNPVSKTAQTYATQTRAGFIQIAEDEDTTSNDVAVTPLQLQNRVNEVSNGITTIESSLVTLDEKVETVESTVTAAEQTVTSISQGANGGIPIGGIIMWSGTNIPQNWALCDGTTGTPNLSGKFIIAASPDIPLNSSKSTNPEVPLHRHSYLLGQENILGLSGTETLATVANSELDTGGVGDTPEETPLQTLHVSQEGAIDNRTYPPYYALAYIMRVS